MTPSITKITGGTTQLPAVPPVHDHHVHPTIAKVEIPHHTPSDVQLEKYLLKFLSSWTTPWFLVGCGTASLAVLIDQLMFRGMPGPIDARLTIPTTNKYIYFNAGIRMQLIHSLALMAIPSNHPAINGVGLMFSLGMTLYSGSSYIFCWQGHEIFRKIQSLGNFFFLTGWGLLMVSKFRP